MSIPLTFRIKEAYKKFTKTAAIQIIKLRYGNVRSTTLTEYSPKSIIILTQERYGDIIVTTPLFKMLRNSFPEIEITVIGVTEIIMFLKPDVNIDHVYNIKKTDKKTKNRIFSREYDLLYNTKDHPSFTFLLLTAKLKARHKVGIYHPRHRGFFNHMFHMDDAQPTVEKNIALLPYLGISSGINLQPYLPGGPVSSKIKEFTDTHAGRKLIGINLSASNRSKEWDPERWSEFLSQIREDMIIIATPDLGQIKSQFENEFSHVIVSPPTVTIYDVGYLVKNLYMLVTTDTSLVHIAACYNTPVVVLYRIERDLKKFKPLSQMNEVIITPTGIMDDITPDDVLDSYHKLLSNLEMIHKTHT